MSLTFEEPAWLFWLAIVPPLAWLGYRYFSAMSRVRRWSAIVARTVLLGLLLGMLAGASAVRTTDRLAVIAVVDVSDSVRLFAPAKTVSGGREIPPIEQVREWLDRALSKRDADDLAGLVLFDGRAIGVAAPSLGDPLSRWIDLERAAGTDLGAAIRLASSLVPPDAAGRIVLISDGNDTGATLERSLASLAEGGRMWPVDVVPINYEVRREVMVEHVDAPPNAAPGSPVVIRVTLRSTAPATGMLRLLRDGEVVDLDPDTQTTGRRITLDAGLNTELIRIDELPPGRLHRFVAEFIPDASQSGTVGDTVASNNRAEAFTLSPGAGSVLILDGVGAGGDLLARTLTEEGVNVRSIPPEAMASDLLSLQEHDLIMLQNIPAESLSTAQHDLLVAFVRDLGGGLVMIGGYDSFGAGAWKGTSLEPILPVRLDLPEKAVMPEAAIMFVLDSSGSMGWNVLGSASSKQQIANESAALAVQTLDKRDLVGVIAFSSGVREIVPLSPNEQPERTMEKILSIGSGGGTNLRPALAAAERQLEASDAKLKHVIVLTDGRSQDSDSLPNDAQRLRDKGIRVTTIGVGEDADAETLDKMAALGGGTFHLVMNPNVLPRVFVTAVRVIRQPMIREQPFEPVVTGSGSPLTFGIGQPPILDGLVLTQQREEPTVVNAMRTPQGEPLLAHWNVELGQVVAFTSDAHGEWSRRWADWPGYRTFWTQIVSRSARAAQQGQYDLALREQGGRLQVRVEAYEPDGSPRDLLTMPATIYAPSGSTIETSLSQTAPGVYETSIPASEQGGYVAVIKPRAASTRLTPIIGGVSVAAGAETRRLRSNEAMLRQIAQQTGGRVLSLESPESAALFDRTGIEPRRAFVPIWRSLLVWALVVLLLDVGTRRVAWDRLVSKEFGADLKQMASEAVEQRGERASRLLGGLRGVRGRRKTKDEPDTAFDDREAEDLARRELLQRRNARLAAVRSARERMESSVDRLSEPMTSVDRLSEPMRPSERSPRVTPAAHQKPARPADNREASKDQPKGESEGTSGLLAAKRRARERYQNDEGES